MPAKASRTSTSPQPSGGAAQIGRWLYLIDQDVALFPASSGRMTKATSRTLLDTLGARSRRIESRAEEAGPADRIPRLRQLTDAI